MSDFEARLIDLVRANPSLYERELRSSPYNANRKRKAEIWRSISTSLKTDVNACISTWNHLVAKLRRELNKEKSGGTGSDWSLLPQMRFLQQPHHSGNHRSVADSNSWSLTPQSPIEGHDEEDPLQEAMDEQLASAGAAAPALPPPPSTTANHVPAAPVSAELLKRVEALLEGLGEANRVKAEKRILAYLCKCNLRVLNEEQIDDIVI